MGATAAVAQATTDADSAAATAAIADAQTTADAASTAAAGQPTDEPTEEAATVVPPTEAVATEVAATEEATVEATAEEATEAAPTEESQAVATEEPTAEATVEEATVEPTVEATVEEATAEPTAEEATAEPEATEEGTTEEATAEPEATSDVAMTEGATTVCLVTDLGRVNDGSFNQSAYEGMLRAEADLGLTTKYIETQAQTDYEANIGTCLDEGFDVIVTVGFLIYDATVAAAKANPDVYFIGVDQFPAEALPNFVGIQFREDQAGFLAGAMAALMTESDKVGGVYGVEIPPVVKFRNGFEQGVRHINPEIELFGVYIPDFVAPQLGAETAEAFIAEGVDVVFGAGGPTGSGGIVRAAELGAFVIGVDKDEYLSTFGEGETPGADRIITSAVKRVDNGVYDMIAAVVEGGAGFPADSLYLMDASIDGVGFAPAHDAPVPEEVTEQVQAIFEELASGELETGVDPVTGALLDGETEEAEETEEGEEAEATAEATAAP
jgi:basic membrane lipoprotein Med (substrate-binding protein (PBP1-ABC) superfamily)